MLTRVREGSTMKWQAKVLALFFEDFHPCSISSQVVHNVVIKGHLIVLVLFLIHDCLHA